MSDILRCPQSLDTQEGTQCDPRGVLLHLGRMLWEKFLGVFALLPSVSLQVQEQLNELAVAEDGNIAIANAKPP